MNLNDATAHYPRTMEAARTPDRPRERDGQTDTEQQIFAATERLLARVQVSELKVEMILTEAGISRGTFYHYFSSKYAVLTKLAARVMSDIYNTIEPFLDRSGGMAVRQALRGSVEAGCHVWAEHRGVLRAVAEHWHSVPELRTMWLEVLGRFSEAVAGAIDAERAAGLAPAGAQSRQLATALIWSTAATLYSAGLDDIPELPGEVDVIETVTALWLCALYGDVC